MKKERIVRLLIMRDRPCVDEWGVKIQWAERELPPSPYDGFLGDPVYIPLDEMPRLIARLQDEFRAINERIAHNDAGQRHNAR